MTKKINVLILEDHQSIVDGYMFRLANNPNIEINETIAYGNLLLPSIDKHNPDVLILDLGVKISESNSNPYPIASTIPEIRRTYPDIAIIIISMYLEGSLISSLMELGINGYILKEDQPSIRNLENIIFSVVNGGTYLSKLANQLIFKEREKLVLTHRQLEILSLLAAYPDLTSKAIAKKLNVADSTVRNLLSSTYTRLGVGNKTAAIVKAQQIGLIPTTTPSKK